MSAKKTGRRKAVAKKTVAKKKAPKRAAPKSAIAGKKKAPLKRAPARKATPKKAAKKVAPKKAVKKAAPKKVAAKKAAPKKVAAKTIAKPAIQRRRDATGHIDPRYAAELRAQIGPRDDENDPAFFSGAHSGDPLAEQLGEEFVETITSGEDEGQEILDEEATEEEGGPFVETTGGTEFAGGTDASNPRSAKREPFPRT